MEQTKLELSDGRELIIEETVTLHNHRVIVIVQAAAENLCLFPADAEAVGLALLKMSTVAKVKDLFPASFGKSDLPPIKTRLKGITDRRAIMRTPHRRLDDKRRARLGAK